jgi:hypothetical protein
MPESASNTADNTDDKLPQSAKVDIKKAVRMRYKNGMTYQQIGDYFGVSKQCIFEQLGPIANLIKSEGQVESYTENQVDILQGLLLELTSDIADKGKRSKASLNNAAYAFDRIFNALRLLQDKSTANIATRSDHEASLQEVEARIAELEGRTVAGQSDEDIIDAEIAALEDEEP